MRQGISRRDFLRGLVSIFGLPENIALQAMQMAVEPLPPAFVPMQLTSTRSQMIWEIQKIFTDQGLGNDNDKGNTLNELLISTEVLARLGRTEEEAELLTVPQWSDECAKEHLEEHIEEQVRAFGFSEREIKSRVEGLIEYLAHLQTNATIFAFAKSTGTNAKGEINVSEEAAQDIVRLMRQKTSAFWRFFDQGCRQKLPGLLWKHLISTVDERWQQTAVRAQQEGATPQEARRRVEQARNEHLWWYDLHHAQQEYQNAAEIEQEWRANVVDDLKARLGLKDKDPQPMTVVHSTVHDPRRVRMTPEVTRRNDR